jgi:hypothetical protein
VSFGAAIIGFVVLTILAADICGGPILFPDSVGYFHAGQSAWSHVIAAIHPRHGIAAGLAVEEQDGISTARSVYYGLLYVAAFSLGGQWAMPILQAIVCAAALSLTLRRVPSIGAWQASALVLLFAPVTGLAVFCAAAMPDVFAGLMVLAVAMAITYRHSMARREYLFWLAVIGASCLFHRGHIAVLAIALTIYEVTSAQKKIGQIAVLAAVAVAAVIAHLAVEIVVKNISGRWPIHTPFLLARFVGDGTAKPFLERRCATTHFELCRFASQMPMSENEFLWGTAGKSVMGPADAAERARIAAEAPSIELGIVRTFPLRQAIITTRNFVAQFFDVGVFAYEQEPTLAQDRPASPLHRFIAHYLHRNTALAGVFLRVQTSVMGAAYLISLIGCGTLLVTQSRSYLDQAELELVTVLLIGLAANALVFGAVSGVFDRYQGRLVWLPALGFTILLSRRFIERGAIAMGRLRRLDDIS